MTIRERMEKALATREDFALWLYERGGGSAGVSQEGRSCPIATYLRATVGDKPTVDGQGRIEGTEDNGEEFAFRAPHWVESFVNLIDEAGDDEYGDGREVTGVECLAALARAAA